MRVTIVSCSYLLYEYLLKVKKIVLGLVLGLVILSSASSSSSGFCPRPRPRPQKFGLDQHHWFLVRHFQVGLNKHAAVTSVSKSVLSKLKLRNSHLTAYSVWSCMLDKFNRLNPQPKNIPELKTALLMIMGRAAVKSDRKISCQLPPASARLH